MAKGHLINPPRSQRAAIQVAEPLLVPLGALGDGGGCHFFVIAVGTQKPSGKKNDPKTVNHDSIFAYAG